MAKADLFVLYDDAQFTRGGYINRCSIKAEEGTTWLSVPVVTSGRHLQRIREAPISAGAWRKRLLGQLSQHYRKAPYFDHYMSKLKGLLAQDYQLLVDLNIRLLEFVREELNIRTPLMCSSEFEGASGASTERLISICKATSATAYLSGLGGKNYQEEALFHGAGIALQYSDFVHPHYSQQGEDFKVGLSIIDALFNVGPDFAKCYPLHRIVR